MTTNQSTTGKVSDQLRTVPADTADKAREAAEVAQEKARRNPAPIAAAVASLDGAIAAAVYFTRRRAAAKASKRRKLTAMLHR